MLNCGFWRSLWGKSPFLNSIRAELQRRRYARNTISSYLSWIRKYIRFHKLKHPKYLSASDVASFLNHSAEINLSPSSQKQALSAIVFMYKEILSQDLGDIDFLRATRPERHLPVILTPSEAHNVIMRLKEPHQLIAGLLYGSGMRINECLRLRVKDIDLDRDLFVLRDTKGNRDRTTLIPISLRERIH